ncbi:hypothetical protein Amet_0240 [Alkaliphilus metalliredigens QYMF]|uniref:Uncharacterized protein n=1 Tax=Alkaliphilus metalliredigens (strain QYMF) TaxID=293826 RepID=A6TJV5_ALKMQ|nr:zinc ribbon domain-containing protein [Alkaliphilus metalliredigens]ABR46473.1 hypothetical protein Amet_0240 [Alkaliphilus metalliredigens QYMF]
MYCKKCGYANPKEALYCLNDGFALQHLKGGYHYASASSRFCNSCGAENEKHLIYCSTCGNSLLKVKKTSFDVEGLVAATSTVKNISTKNIASITNKLEMNHFKNALPGSLVTIGILCIIALIIGSVISEEINMLYAEPLLYELGLGNQINNFQLISGIDIILLVNLIGTNLTLMTNYGREAFSGSLSLSYGFYSFLLLPFLVLVIGGYITGVKNPNTSIKERAFLSLATGGIYAGFLLLVSLISRTSTEIPLFYEPDAFVRFTLSYSFLSSILNGIVFGALFSFIGLLIQAGSLKAISAMVTARLYGESIYQGIVTGLKGIIISTVIVFLFLLNNAGFSSDSTGAALFGEMFLLFIIVPQMGAYLWNMLNLASFTFSIQRFNDVESYSASILSGTEELRHLLSYIDNFDVYFYLALLIPIALFLWAGKQIKTSSSGNLIHEILVFSGVFSIFSSFLVFITNFKISGSGQLFSLDFIGRMSASIGFNSIAVLFSSFILSFAIAYLSTMIFSNRSN